MDYSLEQLCTKYSLAVCNALDLLACHEPEKSYLWLKPEDNPDRRINQSTRLYLANEILQELRIREETFIAGRLQLDLVGAII